MDLFQAARPLLHMSNIYAIARVTSATMRTSRGCVRSREGASIYAFGMRERGLERSGYLNPTPFSLPAVNPFSFLLFFRLHLVSFSSYYSPLLVDPLSQYPIFFSSLSFGPVLVNIIPLAKFVVRLPICADGAC